MSAASGFAGIFLFEMKSPGVISDSGRLEAFVGSLHLTC